MGNARFFRRGFAAFLALTLFSSVSAQEISLPSNWPGDEMVFGYAFGVLEDAVRGVKAPADELTRNLYAYPHRNVSMQLNMQGEIDTTTAVNAIWELASTWIPQIRGWDGHENERHTGIGVTMSVFSAEIGDPEADVRDERVRILRKMNDAATVARWFSWIETIQSKINFYTDRDTLSNPVVILEPNVWGTILQARFHFEDEPCNSSWCAGKTWGEVLDFHVPLNEGLSAANSPIASEVAADSALYPQTVAGLARAMVLAARRAMPKANIFSHVSTWAVYADGCTNGGKPENLTNDNLRAFKSTGSMVNWPKGYVNLSAMANVRFYRELYGWNAETGGHLDDAVWPDGFAVEKYTYDAGMVQDTAGSGHYRAQSAYPMPGANTTAFFWNQDQMDRWILWMTTLSQGSRMPLLAYGVPLGNGSLPDKPFAWKDTFVDWLFSTSNWGDRYVWDPDNWTKFKNAGFIGIFAARAGWPATGTHWGPRVQRSSDGTGCNSTVRGVTINCPDTTDGDNYFFITQFKGHDRSLTPIPVTFNETSFDRYSGFCQAPPEEEDAGLQNNGVKASATGAAFVRDGRVFVPVDGHVADAKVYDVLGQERLDFGHSFSDGRLFFDATALPSGTYFVSVTTERGRSVQSVRLK